MRLWLPAACAALVLLAACGAADPADGAAPGDLLEATPLADTPAGTNAWRIEHAMTGVDESTIQASALVVAPDDEHPDQARPLVVWGHPTRGLADACAPSLEGLETITHLELFLERGWAVVAPDYEGFGAPGLHPYLVGASEGRSLLDAARATQQFPETGVGAASPVALWGFSQGGHAAAFAAQMAGEHTPELDLRGVALAAPVADVTSFAERAQGRADQFGVLATILVGLAEAYDDVDPAAVLTDEAVERLDTVHHHCVGEVVETFDHPVDEQLRQPVADVEPIAARLAENRAGDAPIDVPALVVQGQDDDTVNPADTAALVRRWCDRGAPVRSVVVADEGHAVPTAELVPDWLAERFADGPEHSDCEAVER